MRQATTHTPKRTKAEKKRARNRRRREKRKGTALGRALTSGSSVIPTSVLNDIASQRKAG